MFRNVIICLMIGWCGQVSADIYKKIIGADGVVTYTNKPLTNTKSTGYFKPSDFKPGYYIPVVKSVAPVTTKTTGYFYKYKDSTQNVIYTDKPRFDVTLMSKIKVAVPANTSPSPYISSMESIYNDPMYSNPNKTKFNVLIEQAAERNQVDAKLVHAVIQTESAYRFDAISSAGAVGLMQLMPATASRFGVLDINSPEQNIDGGTRYLRHLMNLFPNSLHLAIAAYNAGENAVLRHNNSIPPYPETQNYVRQVMALYNQKS